ncbi:caspase family protein [Bradyrhizobium sp. UFLA05-153]
MAIAQSGRRVALAVGVSNYTHVPRLSNPSNDALDVSNAFYRLGFEVRTLIDPDRPALEEAIRKLGRNAEGAEASVFYYSGHALEVNGQNLLVPASADIRTERDLRFETVDLDSVLDSVSGRSKISLLILDSCRDNPFIKQLAGSYRSVSARGLGPVNAAMGTLIVFSTAPGSTAFDGDSRNSPFTAALLHNVERSGVEVRHMLGDVRREVREATGGRQIPWENSALEGDFYFKPDRTERQPNASSSPVGTAEFQQNFQKALKKVLPDYGQPNLQSTTTAYAEMRANKAQAASRESNATWRVGPRESAYAAEQGALEGCQIRYGSPCILVAVNETISEMPSDNSWTSRGMSRVSYEGQFDPAQIPVLTPSWRARPEVTDYLSKPAPKAAAIHPRGRIFISSNQADLRSAEAYALAKCNDDPDRSHKDGPCFLYALNNHVVLPLRIIAPRVPAETISDAVRLVAPSRVEEVYRSTNGHKALAIDPDSGKYSDWSGAPSTDIAERMALANCQVVSNNPCVLIAKDDSLIASDPLVAPRRDIDEVHYSGRYRTDKLPFLPRVSLDVVRSYSVIWQSKAMAVKPGQLAKYISATGSTVKEAEQKALAECNQLPGLPCMLYAVDDQVVLPERKTDPDP